MFAVVVVSRFVLPVAGPNHGREIPGNNGRVRRLFSFFAHDAAGNRQFIHFTAYSPDVYVFLVVSPQCGHCRRFVNEAMTFFQGTVRPGRHVVLITENLSKIPEPWRFTTCLQVGRGDLLQFGDATPALVAVNGRGDIVFRGAGYYNGIFEDLSKKIDVAHVGKSQVIN
jgi:hypothetical protein